MCITRQESSSLFGVCLLSFIVINQASSPSECVSDNGLERRLGGALLQVKQSFQRVNLSSRSFGVGNDADLTVDGFELVRSQCCITEMAHFIKRWIESTGRTICHMGGLFGFSWWYDCEEDDTQKNVTAHFASLVGESGVGPGSPAETGECPWIATGQEACIPMPDSCPKFPDSELPDCKASTSTETSTSPLTSISTSTSAPTASPTQTFTGPTPSTTPSVSTTSSTTPDTCLPEAVNLDFMQSTLTENNLGGTGPWTNSSNSIRFSGVGTVGGKSIDLVISVKDGNYVQSKAPKENNGFNCGNIGINGGHDTSCTTGAHFGQINLRAEEDFLDTNFKTLLFSFEDASKTKIELAGFYFTIFDIDQMQTKFRENYRISGWDDAVYDTSNAEAIFALEDAGTTLFIKSKSDGDGCDNPTDPMQLNGQINCNNQPVNQMKRSAMFLFKQKSQFEVKMRVSCGTPNRRKSLAECEKTGRNFLFAFKSAMIDDC